MKYRWEEINQMRDILEAEIRGHHFDKEHARHLAGTLAKMFPDCAQSMGRVAERMSSGG